MTKFFAFVAAVAFAITLSSCASKDDNMGSTQSTYSGSASTTYSK